MILHIMTLDKFLPPFMNFVTEHFNANEHKFIFINDKEYKYSLTPQHQVEFLNSDKELLDLVIYMRQASKIILHGLWRDRVTTLLLLNPSLIQKCYWIMWGGDFYFPEKQTLEKKELIQQLPFLVTGTIGEIEYVRKHYDAKGTHIEAFVYTSNLYKEVIVPPREGSSIKILVGNSSTETNNHFEVFDKLLAYKNEDIEIHMPLSYGDFQYGMKIMKYGYELFGNKFKPIIDYMDEDKYYHFLSTIDIGIFNHNRQQGMGNIITLLGMGKKIYMNSQVTTYNMFIKNRIKVFNINSFNTITEKLDFRVSKQNRYNVKNIFSKDNFVKQLNDIFEN